MHFAHLHCINSGNCTASTGIALHSIHCIALPSTTSATTVDQHHQHNHKQRMPPGDHNYVYLDCGFDQESGRIRVVPLRHRGGRPSISSHQLAEVHTSTWLSLCEGLLARAARAFRVTARWISLSERRIHWAQVIWNRCFPNDRQREGLAQLPAHLW